MQTFQIQSCCANNQVVSDSQKLLVKFTENLIIFIFGLMKNVEIHQVLAR
jgi:hypothetical protein